MRILHVTPELNFARKFVYPILDEHVNEGHDVSLLTSSEAYDRVYSDEEVARQFPNVALVLLKLKFSASLIGYVRGLFKFLVIAASGGYDAIVFHTAVDSFFPIIISAIFSSSKRIYFNHGVSSIGYGGLYCHALRFVERSNAKLSDAVFTITPSMKSQLLQIAGVKATVVQPGSSCGVTVREVDFDRVLDSRIEARGVLNISPDAFVVLFVGRPVARKGLFDLINAWVSMNDRPNLFLLGPTRESLGDVYDDMVNLHAMGYVEDVDRYYLAADVLCIPSYHEGLGYCYLEAALCGCVSICSNIPGPTDFVVDDVTGLCVNPGDVHGIRAGLEKLMFGGGLRATMAKRAFQRALSYDRKSIAPKVAREIERVGVLGK